MAGEDLDLVIVIAPMSRAGHRSFTGLLAGWSAGNVFVREASRAQLGLEALVVRRRGTPVVAFQPTAEDQKAMGLNLMDPRRRAQVVQQAQTSTLRRLARPDFRQSLSALIGV